MYSFITTKKSYYTLIINIYYIIFINVINVINVMAISPEFVAYNSYVINFI